MPFFIVNNSSPESSLHRAVKLMFGNKFNIFETREIVEEARATIIEYWQLVCCSEREFTNLRCAVHNES